MTDDLDFVWASTARPMPPSAQPAKGPVADAASWVTLREASDRTGIPLSTIRNWARKQRVPTHLANEAAGPRRMVGLEEVMERARHLGRLGTTVDEQHPAGAAATVEDAPAERSHRGGDHPVPEGHLLVPLDAWEKMLVQLGNLHSAGQELAEARERAARAETEAQFLRERVADLRESRDRLLTGEAVEPERDPQPAPPVQAWYARLAGRWRARR